MARWNTPPEPQPVNTSAVFLALARLRFTEDADLPLAERRAIVAKALDALDDRERAEVVRRWGAMGVGQVGETLAEFAAERYERN